MSKEKKQLGLEVKLPGCDEFVPLGKDQYTRIYEDSLGQRLLIILDESAELLEPGGVKTQEGKEEDALKGEMVGLIKSITQLGRSAGIHMVLAPLRLSTRIPLYGGGSTTMKDVRLGDTLIDRNGNPTKVISLAPIKMSEVMFEILLEKDSRVVKVASDGEHRFPVMVRGSEEACHMTRVEALYRQGYNLKFIGMDDLWNVVSIDRIENELVRCIEVDNEEHLFAIVGDGVDVGKGGGDENYAIEHQIIFTFNTQRNDASIIP